MQVFYTSPWVPAEWIKAHALEPRGVWFAKNLWLDSLPLSAGVCAFAEAVVCFAQAQADSAVVFTTTCDQLRRGFDCLPETSRSRVFLFNLPATWQTPAAQRIYRSELERLGRFLQDLGGGVPAPHVLAREMAHYGQCRSRLLDAAPSCSSRDFAEAVARFHWDGSLHLPTRSAAPPPNTVPLALVGGPLSAIRWSLLDVVEALGGRVVLNATEAGERSLLPHFALDDSFHEPQGRARHSARAVGKNQNASVANRGAQRTDAPYQGNRFTAQSCASTGVAPVDDPFNVLARGYFENIVDVFQRPNTRLYAWLKDRLAARNVRGIVLWHFTGCDLWRAEAQTLRETFGLPLLLLEADEAQNCSPRDVGRIQAFVETLQ